MIKFFRQSYIIQYIVLALLALALWIPSFVATPTDVDMTSPVTPLFNFFDRILGFSPYAKLTFAFLLMVFETLFFNSILVGNQIVTKVSVMGAFVFLLLMNLTMTQTVFSPFALATLFILALMNSLFLVYLTPNVEIYLLNAGIFLGLATMCYFQSIVLIVWVIIALIISKKGSFRYQLIPLIGFLVPYFIYFVIAYFRGDFLEVWGGYADCISVFAFTVKGFKMWDLVVLGVVALSAIFLVWGGGTSNYEKTVAVRMKVAMTIVLIFFGVIMLFTGDSVLLNGLFFIALSVILSYEFSYIGNTGWADLALAFVLLLVFANKFYFQIV